MIRLTSGVYLVYIYKKTAVTTNRCEESYNQADEPSVPFDEKGRVSVRTINLFNIKKVGASKAYSDMDVVNDIDASPSFVSIVLFYSLYYSNIFIIFYCNSFVLHIHTVQHYVSLF